MSSDIDNYLRSKILYGTMPIGDYADIPYIIGICFGLIIACFVGGAYLARKNKPLATNEDAAMDSRQHLDVLE